MDQNPPTVAMQPEKLLHHPVKDQNGIFGKIVCIKQVAGICYLAVKFDGCIIPYVPYSMDGYLLFSSDKTQYITLI
jgi:hypothetical protein